MKVLLTGGGTAGHVNPALAMAAALQSYDPSTEILFVASAIPTDKANDLIPRKGYELKKVRIRGMARPIYSPANLTLPFVMLRSRKEAKAIIREFSPDLIIGTGGYACWPVVSMGASMGIPTAVHESNALPGKAILQVKKKVNKIMLNFPETAGKMGLAPNDPRVVRVGNPFMADFATVTREQAREALGIPLDAPYVLSFGGSLGAAKVNAAVVEMWASLAEACPNAYFCHATGKRGYETTLATLKEKGLADHSRLDLKDYIYDMPLRMAAADVVVSRAGAMSISELALMQKAAVLIPSPYVADNHQYLNAMALQNQGAGLCVEEKTLGDGALTEAVRSLMNDPARREAMGRAALTHFGCPHANDSIVRELLSMVKK